MVVKLVGGTVEEFGVSFEYTKEGDTNFDVQTTGYGGSKF